MPPELRSSLPGWCALLGLVLGYDIAAVLTKQPTLSAGVQSALGGQRSRWIVWLIGGWVAGHLLIRDQHKLRILRRSR